MTPDSPLVGHVSPSPNYGDRRGKAIDAIVLHYTGMGSGALALQRLCTPGSDVSCHYLVWEDGRIEQLVAESQRAWHAGQSFWAGETDMNAVSIGIEIVNGGHDNGCPPYPEAQIDAVVALVADTCRRQHIVPSRVLGHSDIAPDRKEDPGEYFPWSRLADAGLARGVLAAPIVEGPVLGLGDGGKAVSWLKRRLAHLGYGLDLSGPYDAATAAVVRAFQRRFRPQLVDGRADLSTLATLERLVDPIPGTKKPLSGTGSGCA